MGGAVSSSSNISNISNISRQPINERTLSAETSSPDFLKACTCVFHARSIRQKYVATAQTGTGTDSGEAPGR